MQVRKEQGLKHSNAAVNPPCPLFLLKLMMIQISTDFKSQETVKNILNGLPTCPFHRPLQYNEAG
jgi:hypothetical protein